MIADLIKYLRGIDLNEIFTADYSDAWGTVVSAVRDPRANLPIAILIFSIATLVILAALIGTLAFIMNADDDEEEYVEVTPSAGGQRQTVTVVQVIDEPASPAARAVGAFVWVAVVVLAWVALSYGTSQDSVCTGCHVKTVHSRSDSPFDTASDQWHGQIACVKCHESGSAVVRYGWGTVQRTEHFARGFELLKRDDYGQVGSGSCLSCHSVVLKQAVRDERRGIKMSHKEPVDDGAACLDCHAGERGTVVGMVGGMTRCVTCHNGKTAQYKCSTCHSGDLSLAAEAGTAEKIAARDLIGDVDCGGCHNLKTQCDSCHGIRMPHSSFFKEGGHAREYAKSYWYGDGQKCAKCHTETRRPCSKCHAQKFPSHAKTWAYDHAKSDPRTDGCNSCHNATIGMRPGRSMCIDLCHTDREDWR